MAIAKMEEMLEQSVGHFTWINAKDHAQAEIANPTTSCCWLVGRKFSPVMWLWFCAPYCWLYFRFLPLAGSSDPLSFDADRWQQGQFLSLFAYPWREEDNQRRVISFCVGVSIPIVFCWVTTMSSAARSGCSASCRVPKWFLHRDSRRAEPDSRWTARLELRWRQSRNSAMRPLAFEIHAYTNNQRHKEILGGRILSDLHHLSCSKIVGFASVWFFD